MAWDEAASRVADAFCARQIQERTRGHFLLNGFPPYARMGMAGVFGMDAENAVAWTTTGANFEDTPLQLALAGQQSMMAEKAPNDGHRRTILDPEVTHVGVGWAQGSGRFRMAQEFLMRHLARLTLEQAAGNPVTVLVKGQTLSDYRLAFVTLAHEPTPKPLTRNQVNARTHYEFPQPRLAFVPEGMKSLHVVGSETQDIVHVGPGNDFAFRFTPGAAGALDDRDLHLRRPGKGPARRRRGAVGRESGADDHGARRRRVRGGPGLARRRGPVDRGHDRRRHRRKRSRSSRAIAASTPSCCSATASRRPPRRRFTRRTRARRRSSSPRPSPPRPECGRSRPRRRPACSHAIAHALSAEE